MTDLIVSRGDTFPRSFLDTYRASKANEQLLYNDLKSSKSDELVLQNASDIPMTAEIYHGHSENLLDTACLSPSPPPLIGDDDDDEDEFFRGKRDGEARVQPQPSRNQRRRVPPVYDRVDPEDSIRDIVTENDFYKWVFFVN